MSILVKLCSDAILGWTTINGRILRYIRSKMGLKRRNKRWTPELLEEYQHKLETIVETELSSGQASQYGWELWRVHLRNKLAGVPVVRDQLFRILRELDPEGVEGRTPRFRAKRDRTGRMLVPGPNYQWHVDGHLKLYRFGLGIYAIIDAFSRYIIAAYVGPDITTAVSILKQYGLAVQGVKLRPRILRSDRGVETVQMANAQFILARDHDPEVEFEDVYQYGTSKTNSRIESWWEKMSKGQTKQWVVYTYPRSKERLTADRSRRCSVKWN